MRDTPLEIGGHLKGAVATAAVHRRAVDALGGHHGEERICRCLQKKGVRGAAIGAVAFRLLVTVAKWLCCHMHGNKCCPIYCVTTLLSHLLTILLLHLLTKLLSHLLTRGPLSAFYWCVPSLG